jgi:hypothetical protein
MLLDDLLEEFPRLGEAPPAELDERLLEEQVALDLHARRRVRAGGGLDRGPGLVRLPAEPVDPRGAVIALDRLARLWRPLRYVGEYRERAVPFALAEELQPEEVPGAGVVDSRSSRALAVRPGLLNSGFFSRTARQVL